MSILLMLGATSCEKEILDNGQAAGIALADGQFIVDYSGEPRTRAISENLSKGARINSLTYLLYQDPGTGDMANATLVKRREIPGLKGHEESWPLTRENMTWEQREALKDTLSVGNTYYAVFVANADALLWGGANEESPLKKADLPTAEGDPAPTYGEAYLQLSSTVPFDDGNMFYLAEAEINGTGQNRETPYNCPITLKRVVTRTDWWFERLPEVTFPDSEEQITFGKTYPYLITSNGLDSNLQGYLYNLMLLLSGEVMEGSVRTDVITGTVEMLTKVKTYWDDKVTSSPGQETAEENIYQGYAEAMSKMINAIEGDVQEEFWQKISTEMTTDVQPVEKLSTHLRNVLLMLAGRNQTLQETWKASWRLADEEAGTAATVTKAQVTYTDNTLGDKYYFSAPVTAAMTTSPWIPFDAKTMITGYNYEGFHWVGFANESGNSATTITLSNADDSNEEMFTVDANAAQTGQGTNYWYQVCYRPIASIAKGDNKTLHISINPNLETALPFDQTTLTGDDLETLKEKMLEALNADVTNEGEKLQLLSDYWLTVTVPDLQKEIVITPSWSNPEQVNR